MNIQQVLTEGEEILLAITQKRIVSGGSLSTPDTIYLTNKRIIDVNPKLLGLKTDIIDVNYADIGNVKLHKGLFSTEIQIKSKYEAKDLKVQALDKKAANEAMAIIEKGRKGEYDKPKESPTEKLQVFATMREKGLLTIEEYEKLKAKLLAEI